MLLSKDSCRNIPRISSAIFLILFTICCSLSAIQAVKIRGIDPSKAHLYERKGDHWTCLDGSAEIPYEAINDDYCDCNDGSDEPGTSACPDNLFYCENKGHIPAYISSSRVNDGICEPECCDGSDEYRGFVQCSNVCDIAEREYRQKMKELADLHAMGAKIKQEYIEHGKKLRSEREANLEKLQVELEAAKQRVVERKEALKRAEDEQKKSKTSKMKIYRERIKAYKSQIQALQSRITGLQDDINALLSILKDLKNDHNPNYHDMAVKAAISGYDEFINERDEYRTYRDEICNEEDGDCDDDNVGEYQDYVGSGEAKIEDDLEEDQDEDEDEKEEKPAETPSEGVFGMLKKSFNSIMHAIGFEEYSSSNGESQSASSPGQSKAVIEARNAVSTAESEVRNAETQISEVNRKLEADYGRQQEFAKLDGECVDLNSGEYTYTLCPFGTVNQKSNTNYDTTSLGSFSKWTGADSSEDPSYYTEQLYDNGARCWNGPVRSTKVYLECGIVNELVEVSEPEKCEYVMKMKTPAICADEYDKTKHDEL